MRTIELIRKKRDGKLLEDRELKFLIDEYTEGRLPDYQMASFLMAVYFQSLDDRELATWTNEMLRSGDILDLSNVQGPKIDKHSTGGVGDKVSLVLTPLAIAAGLHVPMISGRGLGHTGGTLDKLESIPGFEVDISAADFEQLVSEVGGAIIGQTKDIAPADKKLYALRDATGTVESIPLISSSIMSKKLAEDIDGLVLDVKVGSGAFIKELASARQLANTMIGIGESMDCKVKAVVTDMNQPLGFAVGNALEVVESIEALQGKGPSDLVNVTIELVAQMMVVAGKTDDVTEVKPKLRGYLEDGTALEIFREMVRRQGGEPRICDEPREVLRGAERTDRYEAKSSGFISKMDAEEIGLAALELGAGRQTMEDKIDHSVGLIFHKKVGDEVDRGEPIVEIHYNDKDCLEASRERLKEAITLQSESVEKNELIYEIL